MYKGSDSKTGIFKKSRYKICGLMDYSKFVRRMKYSVLNDWVLEDYMQTSYIENFSLAYTSKIKSRLGYDELNDVNYSIYHRRLSILSLDYKRYMSRDEKKKKR